MNVMRTGFLLAALTGLFLAVGYLLGGNSGMLIALAFSIATNLFAYWNGDKMVLSMHGAEQVTPQEAPELYALVDGLAQRAALPMPKLIRDTTRSWREWPRRSIRSSPESHRMHCRCPAAGAKSP